MVTSQENNIESLAALFKGAEAAFAEADTRVNRARVERKQRATDVVEACNGSVGDAARRLGVDPDWLFTVLNDPTW